MRLTFRSRTSGLPASISVDLKSAVCSPTTTGCGRRSATLTVALEVDLIAEARSDESDNVAQCLACSFVMRTVLHEEEPSPASVLFSSQSRN